MTAAEDTLYFLQIPIGLKMIHITSGIILIALISSSFFVAAQNSHSHDSVKQHSVAPSLMQPTEVGQSAFAAIAEIVALLEKDITTDWSTVDIDALREHLIDMNLLTLTSVVSKRVEADKVVFTIIGPKATQRAIKAMVPAHAKQLALMTSWTTNTEIEKSGVTMTIASEDIREIEKISNLGFFGIMAIGAHHQGHHLAMALGKMH
jgi:hypothetical protein